MTASSPAPSRGRRRAGDTGSGPVEYIAVACLLAVITAGIISSGIGSAVGGGIESAVCKVAGGECERNDPGASRGTVTGGPNEVERPPTDEEWGDRSTDPFKAPPPPTEKEVERGEDAAGKIRDYLDDDSAWYEFWTWGSDGPEHPRDVLAGMSPGELNALFDRLTDDEIRRLLDVDDVVDILKLRADPYLLQRLEDIAPRSIEPDFTDVRNDGKKPGDPATDYAYLQDAKLFGASGEPTLFDIGQGSLGDCWWMASMGAMTQTPEGRELIKKMITENPNGTYTVRFADGRTVTVTPFYPVKKDGAIAYAKPNRPPLVWPLVLEKALAERMGGYGDLVGDLGFNGMPLITGRPSAAHATGGISRSDLEGWRADGAVTVSTLDADDAAGEAAYGGDVPRLIAGHEYVLQGFTSDGKVRLYNPWGNRHVTVTMDELNTLFRRVDTNPIP
ncbi:C2 family cysteine protease [Actinomadura sp. HBU206391]|uniref:C2 family cysteine protease n=1 Tax=Actinomadura sp. HBU206391 TaxID=2731692 RepID=UPI00164F1CBE|nr:C2 family cysteine protease [Actinomadura sp. HBU206391]MBC6457773.1 hypothetical protein [Actinomadura sp. HBU206391]